MDQRRALVVAALGLLFAGCAAIAPLGEEGVLRGEVTYRERMALPPGATLEVRLLGERPGAPPRVLGSAVVDAPQSVPIPFELSYDPDRLDFTASYRVEAVILVGARPWFATPSPPPEVQLGFEAPIVVRVERVR